MYTILDMISRGLKAAFEKKSYDASKVSATVSNRPDLCEYQCNAAMALAKSVGKKPIDIANEVVEELKENPMFSEVAAVMPGFINLRISGEALSSYLKDMARDSAYGMEKEEEKNIVLDFGGPNVAKPLHVGHLRSAVIGESIKRILRFNGDKVIGDIHLGDWGLQMGLIIEELRDRKPDLVYFDENYTGEYPSEAPFTIAELEDIYPKASAKTKYSDDATKEEKEKAESFKARAMEATFKLQNGDKAFRAIWHHIIAVSVSDLKKNYERLDVSFDIWKGESDAQKYIPQLIEDLVSKKLAYESNGALVVDVTNEDDKMEIPPCLIRKSDGAALYATSDLATIVERQKLYRPDEFIYVTDIRQSMHFNQVFRVTRKAKLIDDTQKLVHIGFGTVNGKDGKPFKTRDGGVMRLENLISDVCKLVYDKIKAGRDIEDNEAKKIADIVGVAALKYADLSNQASKDYVFDMDKFTSFEGNTGPYILYTIVRIKSILNKYYKTSAKEVDIDELLVANSPSEKNLSLELAKFNEIMRGAYLELAPHKICQYIYSLSNAFNSFYHEVNILSTEDEKQKRSYLALISFTKDILNTCINVLGIEAPEYM